MDFLDPKIERRNRLFLLIGYCFVAMAIAIATLILVYLSYGYGLDRNGKVTQTGLLFVSSQPSGASISFNGKPNKAATNSKVNLAAGSYNMRISLANYRDWQRQVVVNGGDVQRFDYPFLFPTELKTSSVAELDADPGLVTQSPDKRWLVFGTATAGTFTEYDLKKPSQPIAVTLKLPDGLFTDSDGAQSWTMVEWAADNKHVLLKHTFSTNGSSGQEYIVLDRSDPASSLNLTKSLNLTNDDQVALYNTRLDQVYVLNQADKTLRRLNVSDGSVVNKLDNILAFKGYGSDMLLYVTSQVPTGKTTDGQVGVVLQTGQKTTTLRMLPAGAPTYALNLAQYQGDWYVAVGASNDMATFIYKNPQNQLSTTISTYPDPWRRLPVAGVNVLSFSANVQFVLAESGQNFVVYDLENKLQYHYQAKQPIDQPQQYASWMDGDRLTYVSGGKLVVFDYDYRNIQPLVAASPAYLPFFSSDYKYLYTIRAGDSNGAKPALTSTPLTFPAGQ